MDDNFGGSGGEKIPDNYPEYVKNIIRDNIFSAETSDNVRTAYALAKEIHKGENRKGIEELDYITHPVRVYDLVDRSVRRFGKDWSDAMRCAALLHDTVESSGKNLKSNAEKEAAANKILAKIKIAFPDQEFAEKVVGLVKELTNPIEYLDNDGKKIDKQDWQVAHIQTISIPARVVKVCDQTANLISDLEEAPQWNYDRITKYRQKADAVVAAAQENIDKNNFQRYFSLGFSTQIYNAMSAYSAQIFDDLKKDADAGLISFPLDKKQLTLSIPAFEADANEEALQNLKWHERVILQTPKFISDTLTKLTRNTRNNSGKINEITR